MAARGTGAPLGPHDPSVILSATRVGPQKQYFTYKGETYMIQAMQRNPSTGAFDEDITPMRDWTTAGIRAMEAADKVFVEQRQDFSKVKSISVPLVGAVQISETERVGSGPTTLGKEIRYSTVSNVPDTSIRIEPSTLANIQRNIDDIGRETAVWKDPTRLYQQTDQSGTAPRTDTTPSPITTTPPPTDSTAPTTLPPLTFTGPAPYAHDREAALSSFLKSQQTGGATSPINTAQQHQPATAAISAQLAQFNPAVTHSPEDLHKGASKRISDHISDFANDPTDSAEMHTALKTQYEALNSVALKDLLQKKAGFAWPNKISDQDYEKLQFCLANKNASDLTPEEKIIVAKAFANLIHNTPHTDNQSYPKVYFKAMHAFYDKEMVGGTLGFGRTEQGSGKSLVIVEPTGTGDYKIWGRWPDGGILRPDKTAFVLYESTATGGKFSGFSRTTGIDARNPLEPARPQTGITTRPAYYTDRQDIETGGGGNCGAFALADAILQKQETYYRTESDWKAALGQQKVGIRNDAMRHLFDHADDFTTDQLFPEVLASINDSRNEILIQQRQHATTLTELLSKAPGTLIPAEKKWLVQLYAVYAANEGKDLDKPFFLAHAMRTGQKIAIIQGNKIVFTAPPAGEAINADDYHFVHYDGNNHFRSVNRNYTASATAPSLNDIVSQYNSENTYLYARRAFLNSLAHPLTISAKLAELKTADPHGYLTLQQIIDPALVNAAAEGNNVADFIAALEAATEVEAGQPVELGAAIEEQIKLRPHLQARIEFLSKLISIFEAQPPLESTEKNRQFTEALNKFKKEDTAGFLAVGIRIQPHADIHESDTLTLLLNFTTHWDEILTDLNITSRSPNPKQMVLEGFNHISSQLQGQPNVQARGEFLQALMKAPTPGALSAETKRAINEKFDHFIKNDPSGYFAYREFLDENRALSSSEQIVANRDAAIRYVMENINTEPTPARANLIKEIVAKNPENITRALAELQHSQPDDYFAIETVRGKGPSSPEELSADLQTIMSNPEAVLKFTKAFANRMYLTDHLLRLQFFKALDDHKAPRADQSVTGPHLQQHYEYLQRQDTLTYLVLEELLQDGYSLENLANLSSNQIKRAIAEKTYLHTRLELLTRWNACKEDVSSEPKKVKLTEEIQAMQSKDLHGWLALVDLTKKSDPAQITEHLLSHPELLYPNVKASLDKVEISARNEFLAEIHKSDSTAESIGGKITGIGSADPHGLLALASLVYDKNPPTELPSSPPLIGEKARQGLAMIQVNPLLLKTITPIELAQKLLATHIVDSSGSPALADGAE